MVSPGEARAGHQLTAVGILICPLCRTELSENGTSLRCTAGHSYDIARSGYVNLHRPGIKSNAKSGDNPEMVQARRAFLARGYYDRYVSEVARSILRIHGHSPGTLIDAACGEGHHTLILAKELGADLTLGIDASKKAADIASKAALRLGKDGSIRFIAGNIFSMPIADESADIITTLFAPIADGEALRVLRRGGLLCVCSAGREHLIELRRAIYDTVYFKDNCVTVPDGFETASRENISYSITLGSDALTELFGMTPFCQHSGKKRLEKAVFAGESRITVSVDLTVFRKK